MIKVSCSKLEEIKQNPAAFAQQLASDSKNGGGNYGMFSCWKTQAKALQKGDIDLPKAIKGLQQKFMTFAENSDNRRKQEFLLDRLSPYWESFQNRNFKFLSSQKLINWNIIPEVQLTGHTPNLVTDGKAFTAYFHSESPVFWQTQLRFPLIQFYLAKHIIGCEPEKVEIGIFCLKTLSFDLKTYNKDEIENAILETEGIFKRINDEYTKHKKNK